MVELLSIVDKCSITLMFYILLVLLILVINVNINSRPVVPLTVYLGGNSVDVLLWACLQQPIRAERACAIKKQVCLTRRGGSSCRTREIIQWEAQEPSGVI